MAPGKSKLINQTEISRHNRDCVTSSEEFISVISVLIVQSSYAVIFEQFLNSLQKLLLVCRLNSPSHREEACSLFVVSQRWTAL